MIAIKAVRDRARHNLSASVAHDAGLRYEQLKSFAAGSDALPRDNVVRLARRLGFAVEQSSRKESHV